MSMFPESINEAAEIICSARSEKRPLIPAGGRSRIGRWPNDIPDENIISTEKLKKIISVEPENLLAIVEAGLSPAEVRRALEPVNLYWPVSGLDHRTLGSIMAEGAVSLESMARGTMTDWILGATFIEPAGRIISSGGRTLKNVSGYDLTRFHWKAWGSLGLSASFILKCLPRPEASRVFEFAMPDGRKASEAAGKIITAGIFPQGLHIIFKDGCWSLLIWLAGFNEYIEAQIKEAMKTAGISEPVTHQNAIDFWNKRQAELPVIGEGFACWQGSRAGGQGPRSVILNLASDLDDFKKMAEINEADFDIGGAQLCLRFSPQAAGALTSLKQRGLTPLFPALEGEIYLRLKKGLDADDLFFPSVYFKPKVAV